MAGLFLSEGFRGNTEASGKGIFSVENAGFQKLSFLGFPLRLK
jgi:hypothetical protein